MSATKNLKYTIKIACSATDSLKVRVDDYQDVMIKGIVENILKHADIKKFPDIYEILGESCKLYYDIDLKNVEETDLLLATDLRNFTLDYLRYLYEKVFKISLFNKDFLCLNSSGFSNINQIYKLSLHIILPEYAMKKSDQKQLVQLFNKIIHDENENCVFQKFLEKHSLQKFEKNLKNNLFDEAVYGIPTQKMRMLFCSKFNDNRPLVLFHDDDFYSPGFDRKNLKKHYHLSCISYIEETKEMLELNHELLEKYVPVIKEEISTTNTATDELIGDSFLHEFVRNNTDLWTYENIEDLCKNFNFKSIEYKHWVIVVKSLIGLKGLLPNDQIYNLIHIFSQTCKYKYSFTEVENFIHQTFHKESEFGLVTFLKNFIADNKEYFYQKFQDRLKKSDESDNSYEAIKLKFEKFCTKIILEGLYAIDEGDKFNIVSKKKLVEMFEHFTYEVEVKEKGVKRTVNKCFISKWLKDKYLNSKSRMAIYPGKIDNENILNLWKPFEMENYIQEDIHEEIRMKENQEAIEFFLRHIKILIGHESEEFSNYFIKWSANMIQNPAKKDICIILRSSEGAGKSSLLLLLKNMIGERKFLMTSSPERDCWGSFNPLMQHTFLVNLNEIDLWNKKDSMKDVKQLITDEDITINKKNVDQYTTKSFHRFIITTNSERPINLSSDSRRFVIVDCSNDLIGNKEHFKIFYEHLENKNSVKAFYEYLKSYDLTDYKDQPLPISNFQKELTTYTIYEKFIIYMATKIDNNIPSKSYVNSDICKHFNEFLSLLNITTNHNFSNAKILKNISSNYLKGVSSSRDSVNRGKFFDYELIRKFYTIVDGKE